MENDIHTNGVNNIYPKNSVPFNVYCHFDDDGQWTLVQRRIDHTCSFERSWAEYKRGFGMMDAESNYWIGLEQLHILTNQAQYTVRMDIMDWDGTMKFAEYNYFKVRFCRYYSEVSWNQAQYTVRMDIMDWDGTMKFAEYNFFKVSFCRYYSEVLWPLVTKQFIFQLGV